MRRVRANRWGRRLRWGMGSDAPVGSPWLTGRQSPGRVAAAARLRRPSRCSGSPAVLAPCGLAQNSLRSPAARCVQTCCAFPVLEARGYARGRKALRASAAQRAFATTRPGLCQHRCSCVPSCHGRASSGPGRQARGPIGGAEPRSQTGLCIASGDASSAACLSTEHSWPPQADNGPQGCEGEFCASAGLVSSEGNLNAVKASAAGAECLPAWGAAQTHTPGVRSSGHHRTLATSLLRETPSGFHLGRAGRASLRQTVRRCGGDQLGHQICFAAVMQHALCRSQGERVRHSWAKDDSLNQGAQ